MQEDFEKELNLISNETLDRITEYKKRNGLSVEDIINGIGITPQTWYGMINNGFQSVHCGDYLRRLCIVFKLNEYETYSFLARAGWPIVMRNMRDFFIISNIRRKNYDIHAIVEELKEMT